MQTLDYAQSLCERKLITYHWIGSRCRVSDMEGMAADVIQMGIGLLPFDKQRPVPQMWRFCSPIRIYPTITPLSPPTMEAGSAGLAALPLSSALPVGTESPMKTMMRIFLPEALFPPQRNTEKLLRKLCGDNCDVFLENPTIMEHYQWLLKGLNNMSMRYHAIKPPPDGQINAIRPKALYLNGNADPFQLLGGRVSLLQYGMQCSFFDGVGHGINHEISGKINEIILDTAIG